jgi:beta-glucosidase
MLEVTKMKFRDSKLPVEDRVADLLSRLTLEEKCGFMLSNTPAVERLGIPAYHWGGECLHGLVHTGRATVYPASIALAATFDPALIERVADSIASEARAKFQDPAWRNDKASNIGITFWTPNINILRDLRWGRGQETYGEDPCLTGQMGAAFVRGLQGPDPEHLKTAACAKHYAVHSGPENVRNAFDARVSLKDLHETYLPAFRELVKAGVVCFMGAYNRVNGEACCGSPTLLETILRREWGFQGFVVSDAGAIAGFHKFHGLTGNEVESAALAVKAGCDMEIGGKTYGELGKAIELGLVDEADIDRSVSRVMAAKFRLGMFDDPKESPYSDVKSDVIQCDAHISLAYESALKSVVLLKNNGVLPLKDPKTVFVTGPNAGDLQVLLGNFYRGVSGRLVSLLEGIVQAAPNGCAVTHMQGCLLHQPNTFPSGWAFGLADWSDAVVACVGLSPLQEGENGECIASVSGGDRDEAGLPANQIEFVRKLKARGRPLILVVTGGTPVAMPELHEIADAILFVWYPGERGGSAVGDIIFGKQSPSGRLPVTFPKSMDQLPPFEDYAMKGRTYRYMTEEPLYPFGFGLSYAETRYGDALLSSTRVHLGEGLRAETLVENRGDREVEEVVQLYITDEAASVEVPLSALKGFQRVRLAPGQSQKVGFDITPEMMQMVDNEGRFVLEPGSFLVTIGSSSPGKRSQDLGAPQPAVARFELV